MREGVSIVLPALDEEAAIGKVLAELAEVLEDEGIEYELLVVDDGSRDDTATRALAGGARVLQHPRRRGYGAALKTGIRAARHAVVGIIDADGTYPAAAVPEMLRRLARADMVVGARTGANVHVPLARRPAKWLLNRLANYVTGARIPDLNSGLRVFRRDVALQYFSILPDQFSWTTTITMAAHCDGYAVDYLPIDYRRRQGSSKIVPWDAGAFAVLLLRTAMLFKPLRVFAPVVLLCLAYGLIKMFIDLAIIGDRNISASAQLMLLASLVVLLIGMLGDAMATRLGRLHPNAVTGVEPHRARELDPTADGEPD